MNSIYFRIIFP